MRQSGIRIGRRTIAVSNLEKVLYPGGRFTKAKVIEYYSNVAPAILPHLKNRPVTLVRYPDGVFGESFYEKNAPGFTPEWVRTFPVPRSEGGVINYILVNDTATLVWAANLAALELHPFLHRVPRIEQPTQVVFDLDPGEGADILVCAEVAFLVRDLLARLKLQCFPKVSGSKGIQLYVPLNTSACYEETNAFARGVADLLTREHPKLVLSEMAKALRTGKVFIDWSQNAQTKTTVSVYSLRAKREHPFASVPVKWEELKQAVKKGKGEALFFAPDAAVARFKRFGDLFAPVLTLRQELPPGFASGGAPKPAGGKLTQYAAKRNFSRTSEPEPVMPRRSVQGSRRRFVVQKHAAQHLHYDLRLEMHDVLKSWAVPKGVPLQQGDKHSAFATEDHPLEYLGFEGIIPEGQYGGGTVMVWDIGTYEIVAGNYYQGRVTVFLSGRKLKGEWGLRRLEQDEKTRGKEVWILEKTGGNAKRIAAKRMDLSALSGRTMDQIAKERTAVWESDRSGGGPDGSEHAPRLPNQRPAAVARPRKPPASSGPAPGFVPAMKPTRVDALPEGPEWIYEVKWDGYRALARKQGEQVELLSLKNNNLAADFPSVVAAVQTLGADIALLDGEIVAVNAKGQPSFQALQNRALLGRDWHVVYYAFDLLNLEGDDLRKLPLEQRKRRLKAVLAGSEVRFSADLPGSAKEIVAVVKKAGLEGVVAKRKDSVYAKGTRSLAWQKLKLEAVQEFVIGGYNPEGASFSSLLAGYYEGGRLMFAGKVRQGYNPSSRGALMKLLRPLKLTRCPFANLPSSKTGHFGEGITQEDMARLQWVQPRLVAQVSFTEWTSYGLLRHATFLGLREDKEPTEVVKE